MLTNKDTNVVETKLRSKPKIKLESIADYDCFSTEEESFMDDDENDPDWRKTPLYNRIVKLEVNKNYSHLIKSISIYNIFI